MPIEGSITRVTDLNPNWPRNVDIVREGAAHIRNIKRALIEKNNREIGFITIFYGALADIPAGYVICDGQNGTPDMRNRVPVGTGDSYELGDTGGSNSVTLTIAQIPQHNHVMESAGTHAHNGSSDPAGQHEHSGNTDYDGSHDHDMQGRDSGDDDGGAYPAGGNGGGSWRDMYIRALAAGNHRHGLNINANGEHEHQISIADAGSHTHPIKTTGGGESHENRMPYLAVHFIMKIE